MVHRRGMQQKRTACILCRAVMADTDKYSPGSRSKKVKIISLVRSYGF